MAKSAKRTDKYQNQFLGFEGTKTTSGVWHVDRASPIAFANVKKINNQNISVGNSKVDDERAGNCVTKKTRKYIKAKRIYKSKLKQHLSQIVLDNCNNSLNEKFITTDNEQINNEKVVSEAKNNDNKLPFILLNKLHSSAKTKRTSKKSHSKMEEDKVTNVDLDSKTVKRRTFELNDSINELSKLKSIEVEMQAADENKELSDVNGNDEKTVKRRTYELDETVNDICRLKNDSVISSPVNRVISKKISGINGNCFKQYLDEMTSPWQNTSCNINDKRETFNLNDTVNNLKLLQKNALTNSAIDSNLQLKQKCETHKYLLNNDLQCSKNIKNNTLNNLQLTNSSPVFAAGKYSQSKTENETLRDPANVTLRKKQRISVNKNVIKIEQTKGIKFSTPKTQPLTPITNKSFGNIKKSSVSSLIKKVPNFALIHQKASEQMEDVTSYIKRKNDRAKQLLSGCKPRKMLNSENCNSLPRLDQQRLVLKTEANKKPQINRQAKITKNKQEALNLITKKTKVLNKERFEENRQWIKGVRSNRRFDLLMKMREQN